MQDNVAKYFSDIRTDTADSNLPTDYTFEVNRTEIELPFNKENLVSLS